MMYQKEFRTRNLEIAKKITRNLRQFIRITKSNAFVITRHYGEGSNYYIIYRTYQEVPHETIKYLQLMDKYDEWLHTR